MVNKKHCLIDYQCFVYRRDPLKCVKCKKKITRYTFCYLRWAQIVNIVKTTRRDTILRHYKTEIKTITKTINTRTCGV